MDNDNRDVIDETYLRLAGTGPEFDGWLSNHGPMAAEAMVRMGRSDDVEAWVDGYAARLDDAPAERWRLEESEWRAALGDSSRIGDWCALFARLVREEPWQEVLQRWWPRLLPGAVASATHALIRTGHAVRSLGEHDTGPRRTELALALGYWAARYQPLAHTPNPIGQLSAQQALGDVPSLAQDGTITDRLAVIEASDGWPRAVAALRPPEVTGVPEALDVLVDAAVSTYLTWGHGSPVMLVHAATAPRAMALCLPALPRELWRPSYDVAWAMSAAVTAAYRPREDSPHPRHDDDRVRDVADVVDRAIACGDEHAIKFVEVAAESHRRGNADALIAAERAVRLIVGLA